MFHLAGLPENVIQYFHCGSHFLLETVIRAPMVNLISFTGSVAGGISVQQAAGDKVMPVCLELGGKDPAYVRADVDVSWAAEEIVDGAIFNSGQSCCSIERVYVDERIHDDFVAAVRKILKTYRLGNPFEPSTQLGPVISKRAAELIKSHIADAVNRGAIDATPENDSFRHPPLEGNFIAPTLLVNVNHSMAVMRKETFGPVIPVMKVRHDAEAVHLMNDSEFGLTASIWTKDVGRGEELAEVVEAGTVFVNRCDFPSPVSSGMFFQPRLVETTDEHLGPCVDRVEEFRQRRYSEPIRIRAICEAEELPSEGLSQMRAGRPDQIVRQAGGD